MLRTISLVNSGSRGTFHEAGDMSHKRPGLVRQEEADYVKIFEHKGNFTMKQMKLKFELVPHMFEANPRP